MAALVPYILQLVSHVIYQLCPPPPSVPLEQALDLVRLKRLNNLRAATLIDTAAPSSFAWLVCCLLKYRLG